jgi:GNAT superfamily N-acetyltransferase
VADAIVLRDLTVADGAFLGEMLYTAAFWRPDGARPPIEIVLAHPKARRFTDDWGRPGDVGLVAELGGEPVGVAWYRHFTDDDHGEGYIDPATPEIAVAVRADQRGRGIGRQLMTAIHARARSTGVRRISLSADLDNPARHLYRSLGYVDIAPDDPEQRMVLELA